MKASVERLKFYNPEGKAAALEAVDKKAVRKWIKALESGNFKQTQEALCDIDFSGDVGGKNCSFCCLGVAGLVVHGLTPETMEGKGVLSDLRDSYAERLGLNIIINTHPDEGGSITLENRLARMNDNEGRRFKTIAKVLRRFLLGEKI